MNIWSTPGGAILGDRRNFKRSGLVVEKRMLVACFLR
jgi:hypothetical protein